MQLEWRRALPHHGSGKVQHLSLEFFSYNLCPRGLLHFGDVHSLISEKSNLMMVCGTKFKLMEQDLSDSGTVFVASVSFVLDITVSLIKMRGRPIFFLWISIMKKVNQFFYLSIYSCFLSIRKMIISFPY